LQHMGRKALARARQFTPQRMVDAYLSAYARLLAPDRAPSPTGRRPRRKPEEPACAS
jgi:hypothetical protein